MAHLRCGRSYLTLHADEIGCVRRGGRLLFFEADLDRFNERHYRRPQVTPVVVPQRRHAPIPGPERINPLTKRPYGSAS
jgi:hypothetical protein